MKSTIQNSSDDETAKVSCLPSIDAEMPVNTELIVFETNTLVYPVVPDGPLTVKLSANVVALNERPVTVLLDCTEKRSWLGEGLRVGVGVEVVVRTVMFL